MEQIIDLFFNVEVMKLSMPSLMKGLWVTLKLALCSILVGSALGLLISMLRISRNKFFRCITVCYINFFRATPLLILLIIVYYALPFAGLELAPYPAAVLTFSLCGSAYIAEIIRSGIEAIPKGQTEAARSLGFGYMKTMRLFILPQAFRIIIPPFTGNCVSMLKDTSLAATIALPELLKEAQQLQAWQASPTPLILAMAINLIILLPLIIFSGRLERRFKK